ncbi:hypothetical protein G6F46_014586 [Rhizopus delemar]|nr:hypothetical protein G6F46_014586 [Rhizopus delemar]
METAQPVIALQRADIEKQGFTSVGDIVQNLSATGSPAISRADALTSGEEVGGQYVDLRGLGPNHTLVLVNGRRIADFPMPRRPTAPRSTRAWAPPARAVASRST